MNLEEIKKYLQENQDQEDVKNYLQELSTVTVDGVNSFLESDEGKKILQPKLDQYFSKGLDSWKKNHLEQIITDEITKRNPSNKSPEQLEVEKALAEIERWKTKTIRESVRNEALKFSTEHKLPSEVVDYFISLEKDDDEEGTKSKESTMTNLNKLKDVWTNHLQQSVSERMKSNGFTPKDGGDGKPKTITREQLLSMSSAEIAKLDQNLVNEALKNS
jgi:hypothetical protein